MKYGYIIEKALRLKNMNKILVNDFNILFNIANKEHCYHLS